MNQPTAAGRKSLRRLVQLWYEWRLSIRFENRNRDEFEQIFFAGYSMGEICDENGRAIRRCRAPALRAFVRFVPAFD